MHPSFATLMPLASAPALMVVVSLFERRWGALVAGMVASAPLTALIGLLLVSSDLGLDAGREMALRMSGYAPAQVAVAVVLAAVAERLGLVQGLVAAALAYGCLAWLTTLLPAPVAVAVSAVALFAGRRLLATSQPDVRQAQPARSGAAWLVALRAVTALVTASSLYVVAHHFGPSAGGAVAAFPVFTLTLCLFIFANAGVPGLHNALLGLVQGLPAYFAFALTFWLTASMLGLITGLSLATLVCALTYLALTRDNSAQKAAVDAGTPTTTEAR